MTPTTPRPDPEGAGKQAEPVLELGERFLAAVARIHVEHDKAARTTGHYANVGSSGFGVGENCDTVSVAA